MFINNNELYELKLLYSSLLLNTDIVSQSNIETLKTIIERVETQKAKKNNYTTKYMREKRKQDKTYGQSYERKNQILGI